MPASLSTTLPLQSAQSSPTHTQHAHKQRSSNSQHLQSTQPLNPERPNPESPESSTPDVQNPKLELSDGGGRKKGSQNPKHQIPKSSQLRPRNVGASKRIGVSSDLCLSDSVKHHGRLLVITPAIASVFFFFGGGLQQSPKQPKTNS